MADLHLSLTPQVANLATLATSSHQRALVGFSQNQEDHQSQSDIGKWWFVGFLKNIIQNRYNCIKRLQIILSTTCYSFFPLWYYLTILFEPRCAHCKKGQKSNMVRNIGSCHHIKRGTINVQLLTVLAGKNPGYIMESQCIHPFLELFKTKIYQWLSFGGNTHWKCIICHCSIMKVEIIMLPKQCRVHLKLKLKAIVLKHISDPPAYFVQTPLVQH